MLIPKGLPEGLACDLFVMISNYTDDRVDQDLVGICNDAASFCGKYFFFFFATISLFILTENDSIKNCVQNQVYVTVSIQIAVQWAIHLIVWHVLALIAYNNF